MENLSHFQTESEWIFWKIRNSCLYAVDGTHSIHRGCGIYVWKVHTPPVSPSSYNVKPSIWRYPWKRSLFTHDDRLPSSYSATRRQNLSAAHRQSGHKASASKRQAELSADGGVVKVSRFGMSKRSWKWSAGGRRLGGQINNHQTSFREKGASARMVLQCSQSEREDWESMQTQTNISNGFKDVTGWMVQPCLFH